MLIYFKVMSHCFPKELCSSFAFFNFIDALFYFILIGCFNFSRLFFNDIKFETWLHKKIG